MRQRRWLELTRDYDLSILYHLGVAKVVADSLSRRCNYRATTDFTEQRPLLEKIKRFELEVVQPSFEVSMENMHIRPNLLEMIKETQIQDPKLQDI